MAGVLIISQEWTPRVLIRAQLEEAGHEVTGCLTLAEGLRELRIQPFAYDLVVLDTQGQDLAPKALRRLAQAGRRVLVLTGPFDLARADLAGLDLPALGVERVLVRPVFVGDVVAAVRELLNRPAVHRGRSA